MQRLTLKILPDFLSQRMNSSLNTAARDQHSDSLSRSPGTWLHGSLAFRHPIPQTWHRDSNARASCGARHTCNAPFLNSLYRHNLSCLISGRLVGLRLYSVPGAGLHGKDCFTRTEVFHTVLLQCICFL